MRETGLSLITLSSILLAACGGSTDGTGGAGGNGTTTSSSVLPPTPDGAFTLTTTQDDVSTCPIAGHTAVVGEVDAAQRTMTVDDDGTTFVSCTVKGTGAFQVHAKLDDTAKSGNSFEISIPSITPAASEGAPASGNLVFSAPWTAGSPFTGNCSFYFTPGTPETVDAGKVWVTFTCPGLQSAGSTCPLQIGYAVFENCLTQ
jgi:hypothetical protein